MTNIKLSIIKNGNAGSRIRTYEGTKPYGPKPYPFDRLGIPAQNTVRLTI